MPFAAAVSSHPVSAHATGEVVGAVVEDGGAHPDLAVLAVTPGYGGAIEDIAAAVVELLRPTVLLGAVAARLAAGGAPAGPGLALWAGTCGQVHPLRLDGPPPPPPGSGRHHVLVLATSAPAVEGQGPLTGAVTGGAVLLDGLVEAHGAVGVRIGPPGAPSPLSVSGLRPLGPEMTIGGVAGRTVGVLDDRPAHEVVRELLRDRVAVADIAAAIGGLRLALADELFVVTGTIAGGSLVLDRPAPGPGPGSLWVPDREALGLALADAGGDAALAFGPQWSGGPSAPSLWMEGVALAGPGPSLPATGSSAAVFRDPWGDSPVNVGMAARG